MPHLARAVPRGRVTTARRGYGSRWQRASEAFRRAYPLCGMRPGDERPVMSECFDRGWFTPVVGCDAEGRPRGQVDHVVPHRGNQGLFWDRGNWQSLCARCGARKTAAGL